jgi:hypothetical protein
MPFTPVEPVVEDEVIEVAWGNTQVLAVTELQTAVTEAENDIVNLDARIDTLETSRSGVFLGRAVSQTATAGLSTVTWDTEFEDTSGYITVPNGNIVIPTGKDGLYVMTVRCTAGSNWSTGSYLRINYESEIFKFAVVGETLCGSISRYMYPTDVVSVQIQNTGVSGLAFTGNCSLYRV